MPVGLRRKLKLFSHRMPFRPLLRFLYIYIWQKGFLDGREGYYFARLHAAYEFLCVAKTYELKKRNENRTVADDALVASALIDGAGAATINTPSAAE